MKRLTQLLTKVKTEEIVGHKEIEISNIQFDSRKVFVKSMFVAVRGSAVDGHNYIEKAIEMGAVCIVCEEIPQNVNPKITYIKVINSTVTLGYIASNFYDNPSLDLKIVAVTGTNGKTTNVTLLYNLFRKLNYKVGMLSTVKNLINDEEIEATHTTPDALQINLLMQKMVNEGCEFCFMEASSHAIDQNRMAGINLTGAVFTNITHDHLDYHKTFDAYIKAKKKLFDELPTSAFALTNLDDKRGAVMLQNTNASVHSFALKQMAEFKGKLLSNGLQGIELEIEKTSVWFRLIGEFNAYNILGVYATAVLLGENKEDILTALSSVSGAKGRFETVLSKSGIIGIVDYAHTPDAVENVLKTIENLRTRNETVYCIIGCGGNRDASKRPIMANIACKYADKVILTSDNPRNEDPEEILNQMEVGVEGQYFKKYSIITDRLFAIQEAVRLSKKGDIILVAGKGHEDYQEIKGVKFHFDDKKVLENEFLKK
ncbi:MAG: UDP-N-acetylmuramoyl-L-alanyl-D-glutamate--2,6-diaminopimelate ligase [Cytophagales bacterium]|nr:MAG: UDP-N-acetylmuramoyl-L-alanyl-D-glutamate--2,6-diaminopimelate ligase [Cytophagales bacterium]